MQDLLARIEELEEEGRARHAALEAIISHALDACQAMVEARELVDVSAAAGAFAQAIQLSLESPQLKEFRHLALVA